MVHVLGTFLLCAIAFGLIWLSRRSRPKARTALRLGASSREFLRDHVDFYAGLDESERARFDAAVERFVTDQTISGPRGAEVSEQTKLLVAASAVILVFGIPDFVYPVLRDIVVYEGAFDHEYDVRRDGNIAGMVHAQGPILLSERDLRHGFKRRSDGYNVGLHEFAHVLDFESGRADGVPSIMPWEALRPWARALASETLRIEENRSVLREYGATNEAEFFAVATEAFFEKPHALKDRHPKLYELLVATYRQDPAA
jgi:Mlc titration factor MtfA (ptsG expression regulator)